MWLLGVATTAWLSSQLVTGSKQEDDGEEPVTSLVIPKRRTPSQI